MGIAAVYVSVLYLDQVHVHVHLDMQKFTYMHLGQFSALRKTAFAVCVPNKTYTDNTSVKGIVGFLAR